MRSQIFIFPLALLVTLWHLLSRPSAYISGQEQGGNRDEKTITMTKAELEKLLEERETKLRGEIEKQVEERVSRIAVNTDTNSAVADPEQEAVSVEEASPVSVEEPTSKKDPIFVVGFPKSGTTTVWSYFTCAGVRAQHYCANSLNDHPPCPHGIMGQCIVRNLRDNVRPFLKGCGEDFDVYAQIDAERDRQWYNGTRQVVLDDGTYSPMEKSRHFLPQQFNLDMIHDDYPTSTFVLPLRTKEAWARSAVKWFHMRFHFFNEYIFTQGLGDKFGPYPTQDQQIDYLERIYEDHTQTVREFVKNHPSHKLVEVDIADPNAGQIMQDAFGHSKDCWGHANKFDNRFSNAFTKE